MKVLIKGIKIGKQLYYRFPIEIINNSPLNIFLKSLEIYNLDLRKDDINIFIKMNNTIIVLNKESLMPISSYNIENKGNQLINTQYKVEINSVEKVEM